MNVGDIVGQARRIGESAMAVVLAYVMGMTAISVVVDVQGWGTSGGDLLVNVINLAAGYFTLIEVVRRSGLAPEGPTNGFGTYFGLGILTGLAAAFGLLLFVIPGVILLVRWSAVYGFAFAGGRGVTDAMGASWDATKGHFWPILVAMLLPIAAYVVALLVMFLGLDANGESSSVGAALVSNLLIYSASVAGTLIGLAVYALVTDDGSELTDVFV